MLEKRQLKNPTSDYDEMDAMFGDLAITLLHASTNAHLFHLKTRSYAQHIALGTFYEKLPDLVDSVVESYQGARGILVDYPTVEVKPLDSIEQVLEELEYLCTCISKVQLMCKYSEIKNELDNIKHLINTTKYKLKFLQ